MPMEKVSYEDQISLGMNATQLGDLFGVDKTTVQQLLRDVPDDGIRNGTRFWHISNAAPYLVTPQGSMEQYLRRMKPGDLPAKLQKELWTALNLRAKFYTNKGDLWATSKVFEVVSSIFKIVRETSRLFVDQVEGNTTLTLEIRQALQVEMDAMLEKVKDKIQEAFKNYDPSNDHGENLEEMNLERQIEHSGRDVAIRDRDQSPEDEDAWLDDLRAS